MITSPRPVLFIVLLATLGLVIAIGLCPSPEWIWRRLDPVGHGLWRVSHAPWFTAPYRNDVAEIEEPVPSYRVVARAPEADSLLRVLARQPKPEARLYALAGLTLRDSVAAAQLRSELLRDTSRILVNLTCKEAQEVQRVADVARVAGTPAFARLLLHGTAECP